MGLILGAGLIAIPMTVTEVDAKDKVNCGLGGYREGKQCFEEKQDCKDFSIEKCFKEDVT